MRPRVSFPKSTGGARPVYGYGKDISDSASSVHVSANGLQNSLPLEEQGGRRSVSTRYLLASLWAPHRYMHVFQALIRCVRCYLTHLHHMPLSYCRDIQGSLQGTGSFGLFCIFDGHNGVLAAEHLEQTLVQVSAQLEPQAFSGCHPCNRHALTGEGSVQGVLT